MHALRAMIALAVLPEGRFIGARDLAQRVDAPRNYLGKLLQALAGAGLLESRKGLGGGFRLARDPASITALDVLDPFESSVRWTGCFLGLAECPLDAPCAAHDGWDRLREDYLTLLGGTTLQDFVEKFRNLGAGDSWAWLGLENTHGRPSRGGGDGGT